MEEVKKTNKLMRMQVDDLTANRQWDMFAEEYNIPDDSELHKGEDMNTQGLKALKSAWVRMLRAGMIEIISDSHDGVVVKQYLSHNIEGLDGNPQCLVWKAPTVMTMSTARMGTRSSEEMPSIQQWQKYAAAATGISEGILIQLRGGDQTRMSKIAQIFFLA